LDQQAYALQALLLGFLDAQLSPGLSAGDAVQEPEQVMAAAVGALLAPSRPTLPRYRPPPTKVYNSCTELRSRRAPRSPPAISTVISGICEVHVHVHP
jgi:hypothetical protein